MTLFDEQLEPTAAARDTGTPELYRDLIARGEYDPATAPWPAGF